MSSANNDGVDMLLRNGAKEQLVKTIRRMDISLFRQQKKKANRRITRADTPVLSGTSQSETGKVVGRRCGKMRRESAGANHLPCTQKRTRNG